MVQIQLKSSQMQYEEDEEFSLKFHSCAQGFASSCTLLLERKSREQATLYDEPTT